MTIAAYIALFGWIPAAVAMFAILPSRHAAAVAAIGSWLVLPPYQIPVANFPDYSKITAASLGMVLGTLLFGFHHIITFRPRWFDLPILMWCFTGLLSCLSNGLGIYDGLSSTLDLILTWGLPYLFGRIYFGDRSGLYIFTVGIVVGGLVYVLPCLWEVKMSPNILGFVYGFSRWQGTRFGGYRPHVFFRTGLECGMWMTAVSLTGWWFWRCGVITKIGGTSFKLVWLPILLGTTVLCRSTGAIFLLVGGVLVLWASTRYRTRVLLLALVLFGPVYAGLRIPNVWSGQELVSLLAKYFNEDRAKSLEFRFKCENLLIAKAIKRPVFGWGGWGRSDAYFVDDYEVVGRKAPTDGLWVITFGTKGYCGLILFYLVLELPAILFLWRFPPTLWRIPSVAPARSLQRFLAYI